MRKLIYLLIMVLGLTFSGIFVYSQDMATTGGEDQVKREKPTNRELRKDRKLPASPELMQRLQQADKLFTIDGNLEEAEREYLAIIDTSENGGNSMDRDFAEVYNNYGVLFFKKRDYENANKYFNLAIEAGKRRKDARDIPIQAVFFTNQAFINYYQAIETRVTQDGGQVDTAKLEKCFELGGEALAVDPNWCRGYQCRGLVFWQRNNYEKAIEQLNKGIMNATNNRQEADIRVNLGFVYIKLDNQKKALEQAEKAIEIDPENPYCYALKGFVHQHFRLTEGMDLNIALQLYTEGLKKLAELESRGIEDPYLKMMFHYNTACVYSIQNKVDKAIIELEQAIKFGYRKYDYIMTKDRDFYNDTFLPEFKDFIKRMKSKYPAG